MASTSVKNGTTAFDQIRDREVAEEERLQRERAVFERERLDVLKSAAEQEEQGEASAREAARAELRLFKEEDVTKILQEAEEHAAQACSTLEAASRHKIPGVVSSLVEEISSGDALSLAA